MSRRKQYSDEELLNHLRELADGDEPPTKREVRSAEGPTSWTYRDRFGSYNAAVEEADLAPRTRGREQQYTDEELLDHLRELADGDEAPTKTEVNSAEGPSAYAYQYRFGSYNAAVEQAGLAPNARRAEQQYTDEELLDHLRELADGDEAPTRHEVNSAEGPSGYTYHRRFDSYNAAVEQAGLTPNTRGREYSDEELLDWIRGFVAEVGAVPKVEDARSWPGPSPVTYWHRFGSWKAAVREAGVVADE